jgi:prevent-host-death family protein
MKTMPAGQFKAQCLGVMEEVRKYRAPVLITKKGRPVAKLVPADAPSTDIFGCMVGTARIVGDVEAPLVGADEWAAVGSRTRTRRSKPAASRRPNA